MSKKKGKKGRKGTRPVPKNPVSGSGRRSETCYG